MGCKFGLWAHMDLHMFRAVCCVVLCCVVFVHVCVCHMLCEHMSVPLVVFVCNVSLCAYASGSVFLCNACIS